LFEHFLIFLPFDQLFDLSFAELDFALFLCLLAGDSNLLIFALQSKGSTNEVESSKVKVA
jgi:hypothetical protein